MSETSGIRAD